MIAIIPLSDVSETLNRPLLTLGEFKLTFALMIEVAIFLLVLFATATFVRRKLIFGLMRKSKVDEGVKYATARIAGYFVWIMGAFVGLPMLGLDFSHLTVVFGALGLGIGLGLQNLTENFISGLILLFGRPVKVGDRIQVGDVVGTVLEIKQRVTTVRTNDNIIILVPNARLISEPVTNLTHNDRSVRFCFPVGVAYSSDPDTVREVLLTVAKSHQDILSTPPPDVFFRGFGDSSLDFELRAYTRGMVTRPEVLTSEMYFAIWYALKKANIEIPFPQRDLHIRSSSHPVEVVQRRAM